MVTCLHVFISLVSQLVQVFHAFHASMLNSNIKVFAADMCVSCEFATTG
jgi:hypothetical protein